MNFKLDLASYDLMREVNGMDIKYGDKTSLFILLKISFIFVFLPASNTTKVKRISFI